MGWKLFTFVLIILVFAVATTLEHAKPVGKAALQGAAQACNTDADCVPATCCHPNQCVSISAKPDCSNVVCTQECLPGTLDCGKEKCGCVANKCVTKLF